MITVPLGRVVATPACLAVIPQDAIVEALDRHRAGDWGAIDPEDRGANEQALKDGDRLLSVYSENGVTFWIITEADRSSTCVLLPEDY